MAGPAESHPGQRTKTDRYKADWHEKIAADHTVDRNSHWAALAYMGCEMEPGLALGSMGTYLGVEVGIVRTVPEEGVGLMGLEVAAESMCSELGFAEAGFGTLDTDCDSGSSGLVDCAGPPMDCRCDWRPFLRGLYLLSVCTWGGFGVL